MSSLNLKSALTVLSMFAASAGAAYADDSPNCISQDKLRSGSYSQETNTLTLETWAKNAEKPYQTVTETGVTPEYARETLEKFCSDRGQYSVPFRDFD